MIHLGDSMDILKTLADNSVDSVVTDPPYGLKFMGKTWDYSVPSVELWAEVLRVLKPGGHLLSFGGTRTYHRMVVAIEDAGFEIRDQVMWIYGSGFPKSLDVSKAIDKAAGVSFKSEPASGVGFMNASDDGYNTTLNKLSRVGDSTDAAKQWQGWGTALKPANEPIVLARKPLEKGLTVAANVLKWGVGAINVDAGRIATNDNLNGGGYSKNFQGSSFLKYGGKMEFEQPQGRWPANVLFDEDAAAVLDEQSGERGLSKGGSRGGKRNQAFGMAAQDVPLGFGDSGGASRFFYVAKASKRERNAGLEGMPLKVSGGMSGTLDGTLKTGSGNERNNLNQNSHPTVKPIKLMEYLVKLITPPGGTVLDPFTGSGSTGVASKRLGFEFIGVEREVEYVEIATKRIEATA